MTLYKEKCPKCGAEISSIKPDKSESRFKTGDNYWEVLEIWARNWRARVTEFEHIHKDCEHVNNN